MIIINIQNSEHQVKKKKILRIYFSFYFWKFLKWYST